ncbi:MAG: aconitate hydratase AcnA [Candidatus Heimdallarchaeota archaeon]
MAGITEESIVSLKSKVNLGLGECTIYSLKTLDEQGLLELSKLPFSIRVLLENVLRNFDGYLVTTDHVEAVMRWPEGSGTLTIPYMPSRVLLQDFTGVPLIVDFMDMRDAIEEAGGNPSKINPIIPTDLIIDHSVQVDHYGSVDAYEANLEYEYKRNRERYEVIKWAQQSFKNFQAVPPGAGICHQVNLEYLASTVDFREYRGELTAFPDTLVGTDSHTPMVNGASVMGWGVGGIEAEAVMLGQPYYMLLPEVIGIKLTGELPEGATATDLVLTITKLLRKKGVVGKFVEYFGPGLSKLSVPDRATVSNMSPESGATMSFFPIDEATIAYLHFTGRSADHVAFVEKYAKAQNLFFESETPDPIYTEVINLDMSTIKPMISGPLNPEEGMGLSELKNRLKKAIDVHRNMQNSVSSQLELDGSSWTLADGDLVIAAITSCTNTSNPAVMIGAGLLAKKAVQFGLRVKPYIKTSLAPGSRVVTDYLKQLGLEPYLEALGFHTVGYGCTTCIGNSGPLRQPTRDAVQKHDLYVTTVLSGNRNFGGRVHPLGRGNFLTSPILVVAYALAGTLNIDITSEPLGYTPNGKSVYLKDIWPSQKEIRQAMEKGLSPDDYKFQYGKITEGDDFWRSLASNEALLYPWDSDSTYIRRPPYFEGFSPGPREPQDIAGARVLVLLGDKISTDHISPAGRFPPESPAGKHLIEQGVKEGEFNTYGSRRGNHEVMVRGTFANVRVQNQLVPDKEGWWTVFHPTDEVTSIFDAAMQYQENNVPLIVLGGKQYGQGSSRDWGAKGPMLLGVQVVIAEDFERIHRSNLIGMGVLPLQFKEGQGWKELGLDGTEIFDIDGLKEGLMPGKELRVTALRNDRSAIEFTVTARFDSQVELDYYLHGGILPYMVSKLLADA